MRTYVGVTDGRWYRFLAARPDLSEINFWRPGGRHAFRVLQPGEPFFFKSHYPQNQLVGQAAVRSVSPGGPSAGRTPDPLQGTQPALELGGIGLAAGTQDAEKLLRPTVGWQMPPGKVVAYRADR